MVKVKKQLVKPAIRNQVTNGLGNRMTHCTIHETANTARGANARMHARLQANGNSREASWQYSVDDKRAIQSFPDNYRCWHAGSSYNDFSIGIEICVNSDGNYKKAVNNAIELTKQLMAKHNIPAGNVVQHHKASTWDKDCPHFLRAGNSGITWQQFKNKLTKPASKWTKRGGRWKGDALKKYDKGHQVKQLQQKLYKAYPRYLTKKQITGKYTKATENAVKKFKSDNNMTANTDNVARSGVYKMLKKVLTVKQYNKLKNKINKVEKKIDGKLSAPKNTDVAGKAHEDNWQTAEARGWIDGTDAYGYVTRQQLSSVMVNALLSDRSADEYAEEALKWAKENDVSDADRPAWLATRQQVIAIVKRAFDLAKEDMEESVKEDKEDG